MFEADLDEGELEIGQIAGLIHDIKPAAELVQQLLDEFEIAKRRFLYYRFYRKHRIFVHH